jgi:enoyl-CoA hydratase/carnithine racemase
MSDTTPSPHTITQDIQGCIGIVRLNRPDKRNAFTPEMELAMRSALEALDADPAVKALLIVGAGGYFSAGIDLAVLTGPGSVAGANAPYDISRQHRFNYIPRLNKPVAAAIAGPCYGLAAVIALLCDIRHVADDVKVCMPFTRMRGIAEFGLPVTIARVAGMAKAAEWLLTGKVFGAAEAVQSGFAAQSWAADGFEAQVVQVLNEQFKDAHVDSLVAIKGQVWRAFTQQLSDCSEDAGWLMRELRAKAPMKVG